MLLRILCNEIAAFGGLVAECALKLDKFLVCRRSDLVEIEVLEASRLRGGRFNLWSVLIGDMRLVGPRPEAPEVLRYYTTEEMYKFAYKPGVTGLAQINGRGFLNWGETLAWDLEYVRTRSIVLDLKIILLTLKHVIARRGAF
jgi:Bacterial sugar transferase